MAGNSIEFQWNAWTYIDVSWEDIGRPSFSAFDTAPFGMNDVDGMCKVKLSCGRARGGGGLAYVTSTGWGGGLGISTKQSRHGKYQPSVGYNI